MTEYLYISNSMKIGKHFWRIVVEPSRYGGNCTEYQYNMARSNGLSVWLTETSWPRYNSNDTYNGIPKSLKRLWERELDKLWPLLRPTTQQLQGNM